MVDQVLIGNPAKGLTIDRAPFVIDNDAFPTMINFYSWRGRIKKKRGTWLLARLQIQMQSVAADPTIWQEGPIVTLDGSGNGTANLITLYDLPLSSLTPGSFTLSDGTNTYTEPVPANGTLVGSPAGSGIINYMTGIITITGGASGGILIGTFSYFPLLPVMGLRDYVNSTATDNFPLLIAFDTKNAYQLNQTNVSTYFYNITYYKFTNVPFTWSGEDYQQFWTTNYSRAFWATNNKPGFHFVTGIYVSGSGTASITFNFKSGGVNYTTLREGSATTGDQIWFNEWTESGTTINGLTGYVSSNAGAASGDYVVTFPANQTVSGTGIAELLTNSIPGQDGIKWYDGDPTAGTGLPTGNMFGWVNFSPPLSALPYSIAQLPAAVYYLVGALAIVPFKDRLLFFSPRIQTSSGPVIHLRDTVIYSWAGTPYYTAPVPMNETFDVRAYYSDLTGFGGYLQAGISQAITTVTNNEDVILIGFSNRQTRLVYTGNDFEPFQFYAINSELGSLSTFSGITLDRGGLAIGTYGITETTQVSCQRIDLQIPDTIFDISNLNHGTERVNAVRDFFNEWIYFTYPTNSNPYVYPNQTLLYNYRDVTWAVFYENFTAQGTYRRSTDYTWGTLPFNSWDEWNTAWDAGVNTALFPSVIGGTPQGFVLVKGVETAEAQSRAISAFTENGGQTQITSNNHCVVVGNFVYFLNALGLTGINGLIGRVYEVIDVNNFIVDIPFPSGTYLGLGTFAVLTQPLVQTRQFPMYWEQGKKVRLGVQQYLLDTTPSGQITLFIYLSQDSNDPYNSGPIVPSVDVTNNSLIYSEILYTSPELYIQNSTNASLGKVGNGVLTTISFNYESLFGFTGALVPSSILIVIGTVATFTDNGIGGFAVTGTGIVGGSSVNYQTGIVTLVFSVAPNAEVSTTNFQYYYDNIQSTTAQAQRQIWHRVNTSLIGDTVQVGLTLTDMQMKNYAYATSEITLHAIQINVSPGPILS
jgi:hypothetical protein